jgi:hypothetical protein
MADESEISSGKGNEICPPIAPEDGHEQQQLREMKQKCEV